MESIEVKFECYLNDGIFGSVLIEAIVYVDEEELVDVTSLDVISICGNSILDEFNTTQINYFKMCAVEHAADHN